MEIDPSFDWEEMNAMVTQSGAIPGADGTFVRGLPFVSPSFLSWFLLLFDLIKKESLLLSTPIRA